MPYVGVHCLKIICQALKQKIFKRNFKNFDKENFILSLLDINWGKTLKINQNNVNFSFEALLKTINNLLDEYAPIQKLSKKDSDLHFKPWLLLLAY